MNDNENADVDVNVNSLCISPAEAIEQASRVMTIRQGDLIYIHTTEPAPLRQRYEVITGPEGMEDRL